MKVSEVIEELKRIGSEFGDLPCVIEVDFDYVAIDMEVTECAVEDREGFGLSVKFLM